jgi:hypothetical protein
LGKGGSAGRYPRVVHQGYIHPTDRSFHGCPYTGRTAANYKHICLKSIHYIHHIFLIHICNKHEAYQTKMATPEKCGHIRIQIDDLISAGNLNLPGKYIHRRRSYDTIPSGLLEKKLQRRPLLPERAERLNAKETSSAPSATVSIL